jgi:hypothetical protein
MQCKACGKEIVYLWTNHGKAILVDKDSVGSIERYFDPERHLSHFRTCPEVNKFKEGQGEEMKKTMIAWLFSRLSGVEQN